MLLNGVADTSGGNLRAAVNIAETMASAGDEVTFSAPLRAGETHRTIDAMDPRVRRKLFPAAGPVARFGGSLRQMVWLIRQVRAYDQVQTHSVFSLSTVYAILACSVRGVPVVLWPHGSIDPFDLRKHARIKQVLGPLILRRLLDRCMAIVFTTAHERTVAVTYGSLTPRRVVPLPVRPLSPSGVDLARWRHRFGIPTDVRTLLFLGRIDYKKRLPLLVETLSMLRHQDVHLLVVGDGPESEKRLVAEACERYGVSDRVHSIGWVEGADRVAAFETADVFALLSDAENFGLSVFEAASIGCPVVISDQLALAGDLASAGAAIVVERDPRQAAEAIDGLFANSASAARMGERAKELVARDFSPTTIAEQLRSL